MKSLSVKTKYKLKLEQNSAGNAALVKQLALCCCDWYRKLIALFSWISENIFRGDLQKLNKFRKIKKSKRLYKESKEDKNVCSTTPSGWAVIKIDIIGKNSNNGRWRSLGSGEKNVKSRRWKQWCYHFVWFLCIQSRFFCWLLLLFTSGQSIRFSKRQFDLPERFRKKKNYIQIINLQFSEALLIAFLQMSADFLFESLVRFYYYFELKKKN